MLIDLTVIHGNVGRPVVPSSRSLFPFSANLAFPRRVFPVIAVVSTSDSIWLSLKVSANTQRLNRYFGYVEFEKLLFHMCDKEKKRKKLSLFALHAVYERDNVLNWEMAMFKYCSATVSPPTMPGDDGPQLQSALLRSGQRCGYGCERETYVCMYAGTRRVKQ